MSLVNLKKKNIDVCNVVIIHCNRTVLENFKSIELYRNFTQFQS